MFKKLSGLSGSWEVDSVLSEPMCVEVCVVFLSWQLKSHLYIPFIAQVHLWYIWQWAACEGDPLVSLHSASVRFCIPWNQSWEHLLLHKQRAFSELHASWSVGHQYLQARYQAWGRNEDFLALVLCFFVQSRVLQTLAPSPSPGWMVLIGLVESCCEASPRAPDSCTCQPFLGFTDLACFASGFSGRCSWLAWLLEGAWRCFAALLAGPISTVQARKPWLVAAASNLQTAGLKRKMYPRP